MNWSHFFLFRVLYSSGCLYDTCFLKASRLLDTWGQHWHAWYASSCVSMWTLKLYWLLKYFPHKKHLQVSESSFDSFFSICIKSLLLSDFSWGSAGPATIVNYNLIISWTYIVYYLRFFYSTMCLSLLLLMYETWWDHSRMICLWGFRDFQVQFVFLRLKYLIHFVRVSQVPETSNLHLA